MRAGTDTALARVVAVFAETTRIRRLGVVRALLRFRAADDPDVMATPSADELRRFIRQELSRISPASASSLAGALRAYLRFLTLGGVGVDHLLPVIASPAPRLSGK